LASSTKKREGKIESSLGFLLDVIIITVFIFFINISVAVPSPRIFHRGRRKRRVDDWLRGLKTHRCAYLTLVLFKRGKMLTHLLV
jgi:hypothetical protein